MKIWMIYDTKFNTNTKLAEYIAERLKGNHDIKIGYMKNINPEQVVSDQPNLVILGGPIRAGMPSRTIMKWIRGLGKAVAKSNTRIQTLITYCTAAQTINRGIKILNLAVNLKIADKIHPECVGLLAPEMKGLKEGESDKLLKVIESYL
jgi:menaquinone-dependent protoporphyrinogen IX oxidase